MTLHSTLDKITALLADDALEPLDKIQEVNRLTTRAETDARDNAMAMATTRLKEVLNDVVAVGAQSGLRPAGFQALIKPIIDRLPELFDRAIAASIQQGYFDEFRSAPGITTSSQLKLLEVLARYDETIAKWDALPDSERDVASVYDHHEDTRLEFTSEFAEAIRKALA